MPLITKQNQLSEICDLIKEHKITAIDTEFIRETTYLPILCLIQINVAGRCFAVDALSDLDLKPLLQIINNPHIVKIFHSLRQDLEVLLLNFPDQINAHNIFDTQIMAALCGLGNTVSYSNLVKNLLGYEISKDWQRSDWQKRPLHQEQIEYAKADVLHLPEIYQILYNKLSDANKISWLEEEMLINIKKVTSEDDLCKNFSLANKNLIHQQNIYLLTKWRNQLAKQYNVPRGFVLKDDILEKIAAKNPDNLESLENCGFKTRVKNVDLPTEIIALLNSKAPIDKSLLVSGKVIVFRLNEAQKELYQASRILLQSQAQKYQISPELIINQSNLQNLISGYKKVDQLLAGWRYLVFGKELEKIYDRL